MGPEKPRRLPSTRENMAEGRERTNAITHDFGRRQNSRRKKVDPARC